MKKAIGSIMVLFMTLVFMLTIMANEDAELKSSMDSFNIDSSIKEKIGVLENDKVVFKIYSISIHHDFSTANSIKEILAEENILCTTYVVEKEDGGYKFYQNYNGEYLEIFSNRFTIIDGNEVQLPVVSFSDEIMTAFMTNDIINKISSTIQIKNIYYLDGASTRTGTAIYYETDKGDYVYYRHHSIGEKLFPLSDFCSYQKEIYNEILKYADLDGTFSLDGIWDLSKYDFNSDSFAFNLDNPAKTVDNTNSNHSLNSVIV